MPNFALKIIDKLTLSDNMFDQPNMTNRFIASLALLSLLVPAAPATAMSQFFDVQGTAYEDAFSYLWNKNIVQGYNDGTGKPNKTLNRAEGVKVTMSLVNPSRVAWYQGHMPPLPMFPDEDLNAWYAPYVEAAFELGIVQGHSDGYLRPGGLLTVEQAITLLLRAYSVEGAEGSAQLSSDIQNRAGEWFTSYINAAIERNLIMPGSRLELGRAITRGQFFSIAHRLDYIVQSGQVAFQDAVAPQQRTVQPAFMQLSQPEINIPSVISHPYASEQHFAISMPALGINDLRVTHPSDPFTSDGLLAPLQQGVGHLFSYPGNNGKIMIFGHSSSYPWDVSQYTKVFRQVNKLAVGDRIYVTYDGKLHTYEVTRHQTIDAADISPFNDNGQGEELILYTCWPPDSIQQRYLVHAIPVETVALR